MRVIHVLRKPPGGSSIAQNSCEHRCGGMNIDASRIATTDDTMGPGGRTALGLINDDGWEPKQVMCGSPKGRWPANLILEHLPECRLVGSKRVTTGTAVQGGRDPNALNCEGWGYHKRTVDDGYAGEDGREEVEDWSCIPGCPIHDLDSQRLIVGDGRCWRCRQVRLEPYVQQLKLGLTVDV